MALFFISCPVVDLRRVPEEINQDLSYDERRETQLLFGETVEVVSLKSSWMHVHAQLQNYWGWIRCDEATPLLRPYRPTHVLSLPSSRLRDKQLNLSYGTLLELHTDGHVQLPDGSMDFIEGLRPIQNDWNHWERDVSAFIGAQYLWGGCSSPKAHHPGGVDCSGLIHLAFRAQGIYLARDAKDQVKQGLPVRVPRQGDALYLFHPGKPSHHVLVALNAEYWIESPKTGLAVRVLKWNEEIQQKGPLFYLPDREPTHGIIVRFRQDSIKDTDAKIESAT